MQNIVFRAKLSYKKADGNLCLQYILKLIKSVGNFEMFSWFEYMRIKLPILLFSCIIYKLVILNKRYFQECIVVCVISLEEINVSPDTVPYTQCREVRTVHQASSNMDKITIAASAAICGTIIIAVIVFVATSRRRTRKMHDLHKQKLSCGSGATGTHAGINALPINCCTSPTTSPGGHMSSFAQLNAFNPHKVSFSFRSNHFSYNIGQTLK